MDILYPDINSASFYKDFMKQYLQLTDGKANEDVAPNQTRNTQENMPLNDIYVNGQDNNYIKFENVQYVNHESTESSSLGIEMKISEILNNRTYEVRKHV